MTHLTFEQISELAERGEGDVAHGHLAECESCRDTLRRVRELLVAAHALPREIEPPAEVWTTLRTTLGRAPVAPTRQWWHNGWLLIAAGIVLVIGTFTVATSNAPRAKGAKLPQPAVAVLPSASPSALLAVDNNYAATVSQLRETLEGQRAALAPSTIRTVEGSLAVIDSAIAEARRALASDPANAMLVDILSTQYERKVELLQRATELSSS